MMCGECHARFEDMAIINGTPLEHFGTPCHKQWMGCPHCGSEDCALLRTCEKCGSDYRVDEIENGWCKGCIKEALGAAPQKPCTTYPLGIRMVWYSEITDDEFCVLEVNETCLTRAII